MNKSNCYSTNLFYVKVTTTVHCYHVKITVSFVAYGLTETAFWPRTCSFSFLLSPVITRSYLTLCVFRFFSPERCGSQFCLSLFLPGKLPFHLILAVELKETTVVLDSNRGSSFRRLDRDGEEELGVGAVPDQKRSLGCLLQQRSGTVRIEVLVIEACFLQSAHTASQPVIVRFARHARQFFVQIQVAPVRERGQLGRAAGQGGEAFLIPRGVGQGTRHKETDRRGSRDRNMPLRRFRRR